jgi:hypothetical protein
MKVQHKRLCSSIGIIVTGFTKATIKSLSGEHTQFYAHPCFQGHQWYDWAFVHIQEVNNQGDKLKTTTPQKYLVSCLLKENVKL